jgi:hypothetical protein
MTDAVQINETVYEGDSDAETWPDSSLPLSEEESVKAKTDNSSTTPETDSQGPAWSVDPASQNNDDENSDFVTPPTKAQAKRAKELEEEMEKARKHRKSSK